MAISIRLPDELETRLAKLADLTGRTKAFYIREAIAEHIEDMEDLYMAEQRLDEINLGKVKAIPLADVIKDYGFAD